MPRETKNSRKADRTSKASSDGGVVTELDPEGIYFTFARIRPCYSCGRTIQSTIDQFVRHELTPRDLPLICVFTDGAHYYSQNNRRLYTYKRLKEMGELQTVPVRLRPLPNTRRMGLKYTPEKCSLTATLMGGSGGGGGDRARRGSSEDSEDSEYSEEGNGGEEEGTELRLPGTDVPSGDEEGPVCGQQSELSGRSRSMKAAEASPPDTADREREGRQRGAAPHRGQRRAPQQALEEGEDGSGDQRRQTTAPKTAAAKGGNGNGRVITQSRNTFASTPSHGGGGGGKGRGNNCLEEELEALGLL